MDNQNAKQQTQHFTAKRYGTPWASASRSLEARWHPGFPPVSRGRRSPRRQSSACSRGPDEHPTRWSIPLAQSGSSDFKAPLYWWYEEKNCLVTVRVFDSENGSILGIIFLSKSAVVYFPNEKNTNFVKNKCDHNIQTQNIMI